MFIIVLAVMIDLVLARRLLVLLARIRHVDWFEGMLVVSFARDTST